MVYVMSDVHGCYEKYRGMLRRIDFGEGDLLYMLGDVIDRESGGIRVLLDMMERPNVIPFMGNHEYIMSTVLGNLNTCVSEEVARILKGVFRDWLDYDGGRPTYEAFRALSGEKQGRLMRYVGNFSVFDEITVGGRTFFLSHAGICNFERDKPLTAYPPEDFLEGRMDYGCRLFPDKTVISGHTPTALIDPTRKGRILRLNGHIALDCGAAFGYPLGCLCLDTMEEFYVD